MTARKDSKSGKWLIQFRYTNWQGKRIKTTKRVLNTKKEAQEWLQNFLVKQQLDLNMNFEDFVSLYMDDVKNRIRLNTFRTKEYIINTKIIPYFGAMQIKDIKAVTIRTWQNELIKMNYSQTYLKTINNQLTAVFNYAAKYYDLKSNPASKAGSIGKGRAETMQFWTKDEFDLFIDHLMDKHESYVMFLVLYWTGIRIGELLALTKSDFNYEAKTMTISKSYQRIDKQDVITDPKTPKSKRTVTLPNFLIEDLKEFFERLFGLKEKDRVFPYTKSFIHNEMKRGVKLSGVKKIRVHDLRHSHASLLVEMGFTPVAIADRLGHDRVETTLNTYSHLYPNKQQELADKLNSEFGELIK